jgi:bacterioferritin-associated ferredoxin
MRAQRLVCLCNQVTAQEILAILKAGALTTADVQAFTMAGTGCTRCVREIEALVLNFKSTQKKNPQLRIDFEDPKGK